MQDFFNPKIIKTALLIFVLIEALSFLAFFYPDLNFIFFSAFVVITLFFTLKNLKYGVWIVFAELFISSKGYLFFIEFSENKFPIRIALWVIVMFCWLFVEIKHLLRNKKLDLSFYNKPFMKYLIVLLFFILWGVINAFLNHNIILDIFNDANAWLYLLFIFPVMRTITNKNTKNDLLNIFFAAAIWVSIKTMFMLYLFTHNFSFLSYVYKWIRDTGVGEITNMGNGLYRIFFQTHIFLILAFFIAFIILLSLHDYSKRYSISYVLFFIFSSLFLSVNIINFSRSNWLGLIFGLIFFITILFWRYKFKVFLKYLLVFFSVLLLSFFMLFAVIEFPVPGEGGSISEVGEALKNRSQQITGEAGVSSRWALLPKIIKSIKLNPILGSGFGSTITYISSDPRVVENNPNGEYTTFAFEWGWLDIWLKLGLFGLVSYLAFLYSILFKKNPMVFFKNLFFSSSLIQQSFFISTIALFVVHAFSPYLNHPLGIGFIILSTLFLDEDVL